MLSQNKGFVWSCNEVDLLPDHLNARFAGSSERRQGAALMVDMSCLTNTCSSHWLRQLHADKVLVCTAVQVNHKRLPSQAFQPPTAKWKDQWMVEIQGGIRKVDRTVGNTVGVSFYLWLLEYQTCSYKSSRNIFASGRAFVKWETRKEKLLRTNMISAKNSNKMLKKLHHLVLKRGFIFLNTCYCDTRTL